MRTGIAGFVDQIKDTRRPLVITRNGKRVAVLMDVHESEAMQEKLSLLSDIQLALGQIEDGQGRTHASAKNAISNAN